jgi:hypothetical protein
MVPSGAHDRSEPSRPPHRSLSSRSIAGFLIYRDGVIFPDRRLCDLPPTRSRRAKCGTGVCPKGNLTFQ